MTHLHRSILTAAVAIALSTGAALAQQPAPGPDGNPGPGGQWHHRQPNPQREVKHLTKVLNLTPDQAAKLEPVLANRDQQMQAIRGNGQLTQQDARQQMRALHQSTEQQLATILTPDQLQQMKQMHHGPHGQGGGRGQWQGSQPQGQTPPSAL